MKVGRWDSIAQWVAWHLPKAVVYWAHVRLAVHAYDGNPGERTCGDASKAWLLW